MPHHSERIRDRIRALELETERLQEELKTAAGAEKQTLMFLLKRAQAQIAETQEDLKEVEAHTEAPLIDPKFFGSEVTQGLPEYELVAGKDTLVRVFVGAKQPVVLPLTAADFRGSAKKIALLEGFHFEVPPFGASHLDYASLHVSGPRGLDFELPGQMSGVFSNFTKSLSEEDNVNFYIDGDLISRVGSYHFIARFYRDGILVGTNDLGTHRFNDTKDLRLLVTVDTFPMSAHAWSTLFSALELLQRNLPVRAGIAPMDSDRSAGLRYYIDPVPFNPDWPNWGPVEDRFNAFNQQQAASGRPDRADKVMTVRTQQPAEALLGGSAQMPGKISGVVLNVNPPGDSYFATIVSQEIGHNFGLGHSGDSLIPAASVFDLLNRKSLSRALNNMFNPVNTSQFCFFSPQDWSTLRQGLMQLSSTGPS